jgi:hypothetical protein
MSKQTVTAIMEGKKKRVRPRKRWRDDFIIGFKYKWNKSKQAMARESREWKRLCWKPRSTKECALEEEVDKKKKKHSKCIA